VILLVLWVYSMMFPRQLLDLGLFLYCLSNYFSYVLGLLCTTLISLFSHLDKDIFWLHQLFQAFSGLDKAISVSAKKMGNTALDAALNAQFLVQIGVFTAIPMIMGFILELGLLKVSLFNFLQYSVFINLSSRHFASFVLQNCQVTYPSKQHFFLCL